MPIPTDPINRAEWIADARRYGIFQPISAAIDEVERLDAELAVKDARIAELEREKAERPLECRMALWPESERPYYESLYLSKDAAIKRKADLEKTYPRLETIGIDVRERAGEWKRWKGDV